MVVILGENLGFVKATAAMVEEEKEEEGNGEFCVRKSF